MRLTGREPTLSDLIGLIDEREGRMNLPEYITTEEVQRPCREIGIRDWTFFKEGSIPLEGARIIPELT